MKNTGEQLYQTMMVDILHCRQKSLDTNTETECCFQISNNYWAKLRREISKFDFTDSQDEIFFFKHIKPLFTSEIEYYGLLHHAQLFKSGTNDPGKLQEFWKRESKRLMRFRDENEDFYNYYKRGDTDYDETWFLRSNSDLSNFLTAASYDLDVKANTSHDWMIARIMALEKYDVYVRKEMAELEERENQTR
jgi:hypothetical protein